MKGSLRARQRVRWRGGRLGGELGGELGKARRKTEAPKLELFFNNLAEELEVAPWVLNINPLAETGLYVCKKYLAADW